MATTTVALPDRPRMTLAEINMYGQVLAGKKSLVEFGGGGSTRFAFQSGVEQCDTVETDKEWLHAIAADAELAPACQSRRLRLHWADIGPTGDWGYPVDQSYALSWAKYWHGCWSNIDVRAVDVVLIDGRFRVATAIEAILNCPNAVLAFHDFWPRPHYHGILEFVSVIEAVDDLAIFRPICCPEPRHISDMLVRHMYDPR